MSDGLPVDGLRNGQRCRILALSGGVRGIIEVAFLEAIELDTRINPPL